MTGHVEVTKSGAMENLPGAGEVIAEYHRIAPPPDAVIISSQSGNNIVPIEFAEACRKRGGVPVIIITSVEYTNYLKAKHPSGKKNSRTMRI